MIPKTAKELLADIEDGRQMNLVIGFSKCRCGWKSETVGGVIERPSLQPRNVRSMIRKVREEALQHAESHNEATGHEAGIFFIS